MVLTLGPLVQSAGRFAAFSLSTLGLIVSPDDRWQQVFSLDGLVRGQAEALQMLLAKEAGFSVSRTTHARMPMLRQVFWSDGEVADSLSRGREDCVRDGGRD